MGSRPVTPAQTGVSNDAPVNGAATNGAALNGHAASGSAGNGHASNGAVEKKNAKASHGELTNGAATVQPVVKLIGVSKSYGRTAVLKGIDLSVSPGELVEVTGPSGSGKTTLLRMVHGQLRPSRGQVWSRAAAFIAGGVAASTESAATLRLSSRSITSFRD